MFIVEVRDCKDILDNHIASPTNDAIFTIMIGQNNENVRCDQITDGGGWTVRLLTLTLILDSYPADKMLSGKVSPSIMFKVLKSRSKLVKRCQHIEQLCFMNVVCVFLTS